MPESEATPSEETAVKSLLDKPLHLLTEDDIAQLTREDCRRYLKDKGMRRPSWNKSQAIQQVIMLKTLLEPTPDSDDGVRKRLRMLRPNISRSTVPESVPEGTSRDADNSLSTEETVPYLRKDLDSGGFSGRFAAANDESAHPRNTGSTTMPVGQMTIFYCGKVNVYDDVPADKARVIMHIAASPLQFPQDQLVDGTRPPQPLPGLSKAGPDSAVAVMSSLQKVKMSDNSLVLEEECNRLREETLAEGPSTRKASVQRYLEKRKDR